VSKCQIDRLYNVEKASIMIFDSSVNGLKIVAAKGIDQTLVGNVFVRIGEGISGKVFQSNEPFLVKDMKVGGFGDNKERYSTVSLMSAPVTCFPMKANSEVIGVINVTDKKDGSSFTPQDINILTSLSQYVASYLRIVQLTSSNDLAKGLKKQINAVKQINKGLKIQQNPLETVYSLSRAIVKATELKEVYEYILDEVIELFDVDKASILVYEEALGGLRIVAARGLEVIVL